MLVFSVCQWPCLLWSSILHGFILILTKLASCKLKLRPKKSVFLFTMDLPLIQPNGLYFSTSSHCNHSMTPLNFFIDLFLFFLQAVLWWCSPLKKLIICSCHYKLHQDASLFSITIYSQLGLDSFYIWFVRIKNFVSLQYSVTFQSIYIQDFPTHRSQWSKKNHQSLG